MSKKIDQAGVQKVFCGVVFTAVLGLSYVLMMPDGSRGSAMLGFGLLLALGVALILFLLRLVVLVKGQSTAKLFIKIALLSVAALVYLCMIYSWSSQDAYIVVYVFLVGVLYAGITAFLTWFIYVLRGWTRVLAVLLAPLAALVAGWNMFAAALLGSS